MLILPNLHIILNIKFSEKNITVIIVLRLNNFYIN